MSLYKKYIGNLFVTLRFYVALGACALLYVVAYFVPALFVISNIALTIILLLVATDYIVVFLLFKDPHVTRQVNDRLSNGDTHTVSIGIFNKMPFVIQLQIIDELPQQFQERNFLMQQTLGAKERGTLQYQIKPLQRGVYQFGNIILFIQSQLGFVERKTLVDAAINVKVYPSFTNLGKHGLISQTTISEHGSKVMRKIGQSMEFEQIKEYVMGDDIRTINWKATARKGGIMVNNYTDEKSQQVYCIIDKGRLMKMPFEGMTLLDYAINATLALTNTCLQKQDKIGFISFSNKMGSVVAADRKPIQRENIMQVLYKENTDFMESDFEMLYMQVRSKIKQRSLLILYTNFESLNGLKRQLNYLRSIAKHHLLLVVFFENTALTALSQAKAFNIEDVYVKTIAEKLAYEKRMVVKELQQYGITSIISSPQNLTINSINKYLELKAKQVL